MPTPLKPLYLPLEERPTVSRVFRTMYSETELTADEYRLMCIDVYDSFRKSNKNQSLAKVKGHFIYPSFRQHQRLYPAEFIPEIKKIIRKHVFMNKKKQFAL